MEDKVWSKPEPETTTRMWTFFLVFSRFFTFIVVIGPVFGFLLTHGTGMMTAMTYRASVV